jgi:cupin 2 domain-containing protein
VPDAALVVHSPLLERATVEPLAAALAADGDVVAVADLAGTGDAPAPRWRFAVERAAAAVEGTPGTLNAVVVAHSAAGALAPAIAVAIGAEAVVLVDASIPPLAGTAAVVLGGSAEDVPVPDGWSDAMPVAYLQLSEEHDDDADEALARGWPVGRLPSHHLAVATDPDAVAAAVRRLAQLACRAGRLDHDAPPVVGERFRPLAGMHGTVVEEIVSSAEPDQVEHLQAHDEWVVVLAGLAELEVAGDRVLLEQGSWLLLPAGVPHRVRTTAAGTRWLAVHVHPSAGASPLR